ncbi:MAG: ATP-binding cassette subfamily B protein [Paraglaciecola sp.]|jgi:ATP-binding cassette subfamily B protein
MQNKNKELEEAPKPKLSQESFREALRAFEFIQPYKWHLFGGMFLLFLTSVLFMGLPLLIGEMIDVADGESKFGLTLNQVGIVMAIILVAQGLFGYMRVLMFAKVSEYGVADIRKAVFQKIISLPISFFEENKTGDLISRLTGDVEKLYSTFSITLAEFLRQIIILIVGISMLAITTPKLSLIMLGTIPVVVIFAIFFGRYIRKLSKERQKELAESNAILGEALQSIQVVKAFVSEVAEVNKYGASIGNVVHIAMKYAGGRALFSVFIIIILFGALFFIIYSGASLVQSGAMSAGDLVSFVTITFIIGGSIASLGNFYPQILGALGASERLREILRMEPEVDIETIKTVTPMNIEGHVQFRNVEFQYPTRPDIPVLEGININIKAGEKIALVGPSGVGKSTIIQLLLRFYDISKGEILVDGLNIYDLNLRDFRAVMSIVPQEVILFAGTIRDNILYGKPKATDAEVMAAAKQSNSWEFINSFPEGLDTTIGERGIKLSGGQRQRIAIARAILVNPAILLLDEATSSLDGDSEQIVQDALEKLMEGRTSIIIAHRLTTIRDVDKIYVLENGIISERGTHQELLENENGFYNTQIKRSFDLA